VLSITGRSGSRLVPGHDDRIVYDDRVTHAGRARHAPRR